MKKLILIISLFLLSLPMIAQEFINDSTEGETPPETRAVGANSRARCLVRSGKSPGLCSPKWAVPPRLSCTCEVRPELLLLRERCCHHTERACDAPRLVRVDRAWCTPTSSVHKAACTIPVIECSQGPFECSVNRSYSN